MHEATAVLQAKLNQIRSAFAPAIGSPLSGYSTAELLLDDGTWAAWADLPIRLEWGAHDLIAVSWSKFDDLWIACDTSLPFATAGQTIRWVHNSLDTLNRVVGATIQSVALGRGQMSIEGRDIGVWTRLFIGTEKGWIEIYNALDENGYDFSPGPPTGEVLACI